MSRVTHSSMESVLGDGARLTWWALLVNLAPYLLIGGVAVGNQVVVVGNFAESFAKVSQEQEKVSENFRGDWRKVRPYLSDVEVAEIAQMSTADIRAKYHLKNNKTAQNWRKYAQAELAKVQS
jgi:hypothetical protein